MVSQVQPAGLAWAAGIRPGDRVVATTGISEQPAHSSTLLTLTVETVAGEERSVTASALSSPQTRYRWVTFLGIATLFVAVGTGVFVLSVAGAGAASLLGMSMAAALALLSAIATPTGALWALIGVNVGLVSFATMTFLLFLALAFPRISSVGRRLIHGVCTSVAVLLFVGYAVSILGDGRWYDVFRPWLFGTVFCYLLAACGLSVSALTRTSQRRGERVALQLAVLGVCGGVAPFALLVLLPGIVGLNLSLPPELIAVSLVALPISLGLAVLTQHWFGVERLARRSVIALAVWSVLLLGYSLAFDGLQQQFPPGSGPAAAVIDTTTFQVALIAGSFPLVQHVLRRWLEQHVFQTSGNPSVQLQQLQSALIQTNNLNSIAAIALPLISRVLGTPRVTLELTVKPGTMRIYNWPDTAGRGQSGQVLHTDSKHDCWQQFVLRAQGKDMGVLSLDCRHEAQEWSPEAIAFVDGLLPLLAVTTHNALLLERFQQQVTLLGEREHELARLSAQLLQAQEEERRRLAFDLHDDPLQRSILLERALAEVPRTQQTQHWQRAVSEITTSLRAICVSLRPPMLDDLGLIPALSWLINDVRARSDLEVDLQVDEAGEELLLTMELAVALFRVAQEALNNCIKHAEATHVLITITYSDDIVQLRVVDNGRGYQHTNQGQQQPCFGIAGMRERLRSFGGVLFMGEGSMGGTTVIATIPMQERVYGRESTDVSLAYTHS